MKVKILNVKIYNFDILKRNWNDKLWEKFYLGGIYLVKY